MGRARRAGDGEVPRSETLALYALRSLPDVSVLVFDRGLRCVLAAGLALERHGYSPEALEGEQLADVIPPQAFAILEPHYRAALAGNGTRLDHPSSDGRRHYAVELAPIELDGRVSGGLAISRDITEHRRAEAELERTARDYRDLAEQSSDVVTRTDEHAVYTYVSDAAERLYGWRPEQMVGRSVFEFLHPDDHAAHWELRRALDAGTDEDVAERRIARADGGWQWMEARSRALRDADGSLVGVQTWARDISDRRAAELARRIADEQFRTAFNDAPIGIALVGLNGAWLRVNDALCVTLGFTREQLMAMTFQDITHPEDLDADLALVEDVLTGKRTGYQMEKRYIGSDGEVVHAVLSVSLVRADDGTPQHFISQIQDISQRVRLEAELRRLASRDDLTGLYNRRFFEAELEQHLRIVRRHGTPAALLFIDLDDFKEVNDSLGHHSGDELLMHVAAVLIRRLRESDIVARIGGDEFAVLLPLTTPAGADAVVASLRRELERSPISLDASEVRASASIGVAVLDGELDVDGALRRADQAMYLVKHARQ